MDDEMGLFGGAETGMIPGAEAPPVSPALPPRTTADRWKELSPLLALLPVAIAKGGRVGAAGLLQGFQQARAQQQALARQTTQDDETRQYRRETLASQDRARQSADKARQSAAETAAATRRGVFLRQFMEGFGAIETPEQLDSYLALMVPEGQSLGVRPDVMRGYAQQALAPSTTQQRAATRAIDGLRKQYGEKWMETAAQFRHTVRGVDQPVSLDELLAMAGSPRDPNYVKPAETPKDRRAFTPVQITVNGSKTPVTANYDPDTGQYYAIGSTVPLSGTIQKYEAPPRETGSVPAQEWVIRNGEVTPIPKGTRQPGDEPYDPVRARQAPREQDIAYVRDLSSRARDMAKELLGEVSKWTSGYGSLLSRMPETDARYFSERLRTLRANLSFSELAKMRQASRTGGALGNISDTEIGLLGSATGAIADPAIGPDQMRRELQRIVASMNKIDTAAAKDLGEPAPVRRRPGSDPNGLMPGQTPPAVPRGPTRPKFELVR
jgi:hypothetical protein